MATTWGQFTWGSNSWNTEVNTISPTGIALTANLGSPAAFSTKGWGRYAWGDLSWGVHYSNITEIPTGIAMTAVLGDETITTEINTGWGRSTWGDNAWGIAGDVQTGSFDLSTALNSVTITNEINIGWGSDPWGVEGWGASIQVVQPSGIALTMAEGGAGISIGGDSNLTLTGNSATVVTGTALAYSLVTVSFTGIPMTMNLSFDPEYVSPTGIAMSMALGTVVADANTIAEVSATSVLGWGQKNSWGNGNWGNDTGVTLAMSMLLGTTDAAPDAAPTGQAMAIDLGNETITADANTGALTGIAMTAALASVVADANTIPTITGFGLAMQEGDEETSGNANVDLTGNSLTLSLGTATNVLIWNEVPTGTAPVDPPGWQEVDTSAA